MLVAGVLSISVYKASPDGIDTSGNRSVLTSNLYK